MQPPSYNLPPGLRKRQKNAYGQDLQEQALERRSGNNMATPLASTGRQGRPAGGETRNNVTNPPAKFAPYGPLRQRGKPALAPRTPVAPGKSKMEIPDINSDYRRKDAIFRRLRRRL